MEGIKIAALGHYAPENVVTNFDLEKIVDTSDEWIQSRTGIQKRHISKNQNTSELAYLAAKSAIEKYNIDTSRIRYIICATFTPDHLTPSVACIVQKKLGLNNQMAFDINAACSGFVYALSIAKGLLKENEYALVIGAEVISKVVDWSDRSTCVLFGDGAGCAIVEKADKLFIDEHLASGNTNALFCPGIKFNDSLQGYLQMDGQEVFKFAVNAILSSIQSLLEKSKLRLEDIDHIVCHQANARIINYVIKRLKADPSKFYMNLSEYGNTSAASIPIALSSMSEEGLLKQGQKVMCIGFGSGLTWGAVLLEW